MTVVPFEKDVGIAVMIAMRASMHIEVVAEHWSNSPMSFVLPFAYRLLVTAGGFASTCGTRRGADRDGPSRGDDERGLGRAIDAGDGGAEDVPDGRRHLRD